MQLGQVWKATVSQETRQAKEQRSKGLAGCFPLVVRVGDTGYPSDFVKLTLPRASQDSMEKL